MNRGQACSHHPQVVQAQAVSSGMTPGFKAGSAPSSMALTSGIPGTQSVSPMRPSVRS